MKAISQVYYYLLYFLRSGNEHSVHSPFVFELVTKVVYNDKDYYGYRNVEDLRRELLDSEKVIHCQEIGADSGSKTRSVADLAKKVAKQPKYGRLLFRLCDHFQPSEILELGTSMGLSTAYLALANSRSKIISIEGCEEVARQAEENFKKLELKNVHQRLGNFDNVLPEVLKEISNLDMVFFDGNHRKEPTLSYFQQCLAKANENSVFIFDDIYWSSEMKEAWEEIKKNEQVRVTIDLYSIGIVFFRKEQAKEHFVIRF